MYEECSYWNCFSFLLIISNPALALVAQIELGQKTLSFEDSGAVSNDDVTGTKTVCPSRRPIPLVPVGIGLYLQAWSGDDPNSTIDSTAMAEMGLQVSGWLPMVPFVNLLTYGTP